MYAQKNKYNFMAVKIEKGKVLSTLDMIKTSWGKIFPAIEFDAIMQDQVFVDYIRTTRGNYVIFMAISFMILGTSCMGLLGLISINLIRREKEIGIRKVIGASESKLLIMLNRDFVILLVLSFVIATPLGSFLLDSLMSMIAYHVEIGSTSFVLSYIVISVITIGIIFKQVYKVVSSNPVDVLRKE